MGTGKSTIVKVRGEPFVQGICLGKGAYASVHYVHHKISKRPMVLKRISKSHIIKDPFLVEGINLELEILKLMKDNPFVLKLHAAEQTPDFLFLLLEYCQGGPLSYHLLLMEPQAFSERKVSILISEIIAAVEEVHSHKIIHRDIKTSNILVNDDGHCILCDFNSSAMVGDDGMFANEHGLRVGTLQYMAPEILRREAHSQKADWFSVGVVAFELFHNGFPWSDHEPDSTSKDLSLARQMDAIITSKPLNFSPHCSEGFAELLKGLLAPNPDNRLSIDAIKALPFFHALDWKKIAARENTPLFRLGKNEFYHDRQAMIEESLGILNMDNILPLTPEQQKLFDTWDWVNPDTSLVPSPQQLDVAYLKKHHQFPLGLQVYRIEEGENPKARCTGQGKIIFSLDELPVGISFLSPHGALIKRTRQNTVKIMDFEVTI